jgi:hypothetical protein
MNHGKKTPSERWLRENTMLWGTVRLPRSHMKANGLVEGSSRSGKTTMLLVWLYSILKYLPDSKDIINAFVFDPKNQFYKAFMEWDIDLPVVLTNVLDRRAWAWRIDRDIRDPAAAEALAYELMPEKPGGGENRYFEVAPRHVAAGVFRELVGLGRPWTLRIAYWLATNWFYARQLIGRSRDPLVREKLVHMDAAGGRQTHGVHTSLMAQLGDIATYAALMEHAPRKFTIRQLIESDVVVVMGSDFRLHRIVEPMNRVMLSIARQELLNRMDDVHGRELHLIVADEFAKLNGNRPIDQFESFLEMGGSKSVHTVVAVQSRLQLAGIYSKELMEVIAGQAQNKMTFRVSDRGGAELASQSYPYQHGYDRILTDGETDQPGGVRSRSRTSSEQRVDRPLVHPDELMHLPLADWGRGWRGFAVTPYLAKTKWFPFEVTRAFLEDHLPDARGVIERELADVVSPYEQCRRAGDEQYLWPLTRDELDVYGLEPDPNEPRD